MAWSPKGGGPWGGGGSGGGPWGGGPTSPDIEELLRKSQASVRRFMPGGAGGAKGIVLMAVAAGLVWGLTGFYRIQPGEQGVELLFGEFVKRTGPGLNYWPPEPVGEVIKVNVENTNTINIGFRGPGNVGRGTGARDVALESLMLTGDQNIADIDFIVQWRIKNAADYLFNIRDSEGTIKVAAESAMREIVGQTTLEDAITKNRAGVEQRTRQLLQKILDDYGAGIAVAELKMQKADPPKEVIDAFNDVQRARQDQERSVNEAVAYRNDVVPKAKGEAEKLIAEATAYKERVIKDAQGEAERFLSVYSAYLTNTDITKRRLYLERMQEILSKTDKIILDEGNKGSNVVPYLPLTELGKKRGGAK
ncbi:MAG: FtsH protease activity modulator HflK [Rhodospirillaceae bacterium]